MLVGGHFSVHWQRNSYEASHFSRSARLPTLCWRGVRMHDDKKLVRLAQANVARSRQAIADATEATSRCEALCEAARERLAADMALLERLKDAHERTGIIRG
jgi:hypothetical protein